MFFLALNSLLNVAASGRTSLASLPYILIVFTAISNQGRFFGILILRSNLERLELTQSYAKRLLNNRPLASKTFINYDSISRYITLSRMARFISRSPTILTRSQTLKHIPWCTNTKTIDSLNSKASKRRAPTTCSRSIMEAFRTLPLPSDSMETVEISRAKFIRCSKVALPRKTFCRDRIT